MKRVQHFMIDPPWPLGTIVRGNDIHGKLDYQTMTVKDIFKFLDKKILSKGDKKGHNAFIWVLQKYLIETDYEMKKRGYKRHVIIIWDKLNGSYMREGTIRICHEELIWYYKYKLLKVDKNVRGYFGTVIREKRRQHSRKPDQAYSLIERLYPNQIYMDVFSRENRPGWLQFGNQTNMFSGWEKMIKL